MRGLMKINLQRLLIQFAEEENVEKLRELANNDDQLQVHDLARSTIRFGEYI